MADGINEISDQISFEQAFMTTERLPAKTFQDWVVWQKAHQLVLAIYEFTAHFPKSETYGLALQMRKAAVSIPANIAEGFRRRGCYEIYAFMPEPTWTGVGMLFGRLVNYCFFGFIDDFC